MKLGIRYATTYSYERAVAFGTHEIRLFPRNDRFCGTRRISFQTRPASTLRFIRDVFDNDVALCSFSDPSSILEFRLAIDVEVEEKNPFDFILARDASEVPFLYPREMEPFTAAYRNRQTKDVLELAAWKPPTSHSRRGTVDALVALNRALHENIGYERREKGAARSPAETLSAMRGACRDVAVLLAEMLRELGLAARLVSGYLRETDDTIRRSEGSMHAWTEVFLPGAGWVGLDPTNGIFCNHNFISAAAGLRPADITPVSGSFSPRQAIPVEMTSGLEMLNL